MGETITERIGNTPLLRIRLFEDECPDVAVFAKAEFLNPGGSVKDRPALRMIEDGERSGGSLETASSWTAPAGTPASRTR